MTISASNLETHQATAADAEAGTVDVAGRSPLQLAVERFRKDKLSMVSFIITVLFVIVAIAAPILKKVGVLDPYSFHYNLLNGYFPAGGSYGVSGAHPLGVEPGTGRDLLARILLGITLSLTIALTGSILTVMIGVVFGIISGFSRGIVDSIIGRFIDLVLCFPSTLMLLALSGVVVDRMAHGAHILGLHLYFPGGESGTFVNGAYVVIVLAIFGWPPIARLLRGQVLTIREREFVDAAILMGASRFRIYFKEILPNLWAPILVYFTLLMPAYVSAEAALSFLGVGIKGDTPTLGNVLTAAQNYQDTDPIYFFVPAVMIALLVISFNLLGDGARDALDPKGNR